MTSVSLVQFYDLLEQHDWYYDFIEDRAAWKRGRASHELLLMHMNASLSHAALYAAYANFVLNGQGTKPARPQER